MASDPRDYRVDISGAQPSGRGGEKADPGSRPFLSVHFACCGVYCRIYRNSDANAYAGRCPRCGKSVRFLVGQDGTDQRFFVVK